VPTFAALAPLLELSWLETSWLEAVAVLTAATSVVMTGVLPSFAPGRRSFRRIVAHL
jgi:hypothetical protein